VLPGLTPVGGGGSRREGRGADIEKASLPGEESPANNYTRGGEPLLIAGL